MIDIKKEVIFNQLHSKGYVKIADYKYSHPLFLHIEIDLIDINLNDSAEEFCLQIIATYYYNIGLEDGKKLGYMNGYKQSQNDGRAWE